MKPIFLLIILAIFLPINALSVTPLYYHTFAIAQIEACVEEIVSIGIPTLKTDELMLKKSREESTYIRDIQKISLKVLRVIEFEKRDPRVPSLFEGAMIVITNPFTDQRPPFKVGDRIAVRVRLVLPEQEYNPEDQRKHWWFFPKGEKEDIFPPRRSFR